MNQTEARPHLQPALDDPRVVAALEEYMAAAEAGRRPDRNPFLARHAAVADVLAPCLDGMEMLHGLDPSGDGSTPPLLATPLGDFRLIREVGRGVRRRGPGASAHRAGPRRRLRARRALLRDEIHRWAIARCCLRRPAPNFRAATVRERWHATAP